MNWLDFLQSQRDAIFLVIGALIGFLSSTAMWRRQLKEERKRKRSDHILRAIQLAGSSLTYARALLYSKTQGIKGVLSLPENPIDELMAIVGLYFHEVAPLVQQLHDKQQAIFSHRADTNGAADSMLAILNEMPAIVNRLTTQLGDLADQ